MVVLEEWSNRICKRGVWMTPSTWMSLLQSDVSPSRGKMSGMFSVSGMSGMAGVCLFVVCS